METSDLVVEVGNRFGPEAMEGLRLYNRLNENPRPAREVETMWPRWFTENPFGSGMFSVARAGGRVVGFNTFIAAEMRLGGRVLRGGKGEFFAVEPEFRKAVDPGTKTALPFALFSGLLRRAREFGMEAVFMVTNPAASLVNLWLGAKPMKLDYVEYITFFRRPRRALHPNPVRNFVLGLGAVGYTSTRRVMASYSAGSAGQVEPFESFEQVPLSPAEGVNLLINESPGMLAHRFAGHRYWKYLVREPGRPPAAFVFTRFPDDVQLAWWSAVDVGPESFAHLLRQVGERARRDGASNLRVNLPADAAPPGWELARWGFFQRPLQQTVFLYSADPELMAARTALPWRFTNAHVGFY